MIETLVLAGAASAEVELVGGVTYNTYSIDWGEPSSDPSEIEFNSGFGAYVGAQYWATPTLAIGAQTDYFTGSDKISEQTTDYDGDGILDVESYQTRLIGTGYLATLTLKLQPRVGVEARPFAAIGPYRVTLNNTFSIKPSDPHYAEAGATLKVKGDPQFGGKVGLNLIMELTPGINLGATVAYRFVNEFTRGTIEFMDLTTEANLKGINASGFSAGATLSFPF